uniref:AlNc14C549G12130 protein n=1 Tax=Albugo laibachii Nc14 TaxID=890382 RepID=F0X138_9STRA|nr:AlNc14C549G12130 [Albugo laibachii Nc14]|eukprot:CCA27492.1 AlNc14C549G12130 [Albugo laibachii Nc14]
MLLEFKSFLENKMNKMDKIRRSIDIMKTAKEPYICAQAVEPSGTRCIYQMISLHHRICTSLLNQLQDSEVKHTRIMTSVRHVRSNLRRVQMKPDQLEWTVLLTNMQHVETKCVHVMASSRH